MSFIAPIVLVCGIGIVLWCIITIFIIQNTRKISTLYRKQVNPKFPVSGEEIWNTLESIKSPVHKLRVMLNIFETRFAIIGAKNTGDQELDSLSKKGRVLIVLWLLFMLLSAITIVYLSTHA